ncbi:MAG: tRNA pseudouridine(13) synthase TruD [Candidatus Bathyarchaeia archaeon]
METMLHLNLPYITADMPGVGGRLRLKDEYFIVEELPLYNPVGDGRHLYVNLTKKGLTTIEVQHRLAELFNLNPRDIGYAGLKDKHAFATQTFSIPLENGDEKIIGKVIEHVRKSMPVTVNWARLHRNKLRPGHLLGNRFRVTITDLNVTAGEAECRAKAIVEKLKVYGVPNFFGPQRFGFQGDNIIKGMNIVRGRLRVKDKWLRRFLISSYQSYLCNLYLTRRIESGLFYKILAGDIAKKYSTGGMFIVEDAEREQLRYDRQEISFTAPIYGSKMWMAGGPAGEFESEILREAGVTLDMFDQVKVEGTRRLGRLSLHDLQVEIEGSNLVVSFTLPKGAFATSVLREIMKTEPEAMRCSLASS